MSRVYPLLILISAIGCRGDEEGGLIPVTGVVHNADGSRMQFENGRVIFAPANGGRSASGSVEKDGTFVMMTEAPGDGVQPGDYKVILNIWTSYRDQTSAVPEEYTDPATTPLEATVDADNDRFDFVVER
jgi:hypothetical protein